MNPCAHVQEEEWRRNPPLSTRASCSRPFPRGRCSERYLGDIICSGSGSGSIFDVANAIPGKSDGRNTSHAGRSNGGGGSSTSSSGANNAARADAFNAEWRVHDADPDGCPDDYRDDGGSLFTPSTSPLKATKRGRETNGSSSSNGNTLGWRKGRMAAAGEQGRERGEGRTRTGRPAAWPPGGLSDGEGLPFNDLPDVSSPHSLVKHRGWRLALLHTCWFLVHRSTLVFVMMRRFSWRERLILLLNLCFASPLVHTTPMAGNRRQDRVLRVAAPVRVETGRAVSR